jgi:phosphatidylglycerophosphate synthase
MRGEGDTRAIALLLESSQANAIPPDAPSLAAVTDALLASGAIARLDEQLFPAYMDKLRRSLPYWIYRVDDSAARRALERKMFWDNYKGSTDLLTAYVYPPLVWPIVRLCARWHIHPNVITVLSIILAFAAVPLFAGAHWVSGFICAYVMSVLDSVDGKLARLTLTDSNIGNVLDHGLDQVHPPFWYFAWAWGLGARSSEEPLYQAAIWLIVFYFADRIVLGIGKRRLGHALHAAGPLDERVRSIIARRNITMTIMAVALLMSAGVAGFYIVTIWQGLTFAWHTWRTLWLGFLRPPRRQARPE